MVGYLYETKKVVALKLCLLEVEHLNLQRLSMDHIHYELYLMSSNFTFLYRSYRICLHIITGSFSTLNINE